MKHLFLFTITPVQDFISQSRKLKDLFGSSEILSDMSEIGIKICKREGGNIVFPHYDENYKYSSYPNRFLVEFESKDINEIKNIANSIEERLKRFIRSLNNKNSEIGKTIENHLENYFNFYWAISELKGSYKEAFDEVEKLLAGAKNTRFFNQFMSDGEIGEKGRKCSICGERNVVIYKAKDKYKFIKYNIPKPIEDKNSLLKFNEGLCGVCYVKRKYSKVNFDSTAEIALMHIFDKLKKEDYPNLSKDYQLFFEENLKEEYFKRNDISANLNKCKKEFKKFKEALKDNNLKQTPYYAVIMFDGDSMGEWLSGKYVDKEKLKTFHNFLSQRLIEYANKARDVLKKSKGITVYAGGEDFLGFVNLNYLFETLRELRNKWNEIVNNPLKNEFNINKDLTFSAGVVVAHYKTPLQAVLQRVREAEKKAKNKDDKKNKICFVALKRSGEIREAIVEYEKYQNLEDILRVLKKDFSDNFITILEKEFISMLDNNGNLKLSNRKSLMKIEIKRLLNRSKMENVGSEEVENILKNIEKLIEINFINFINSLYFVRFLKRETNDN